MKASASLLINMHRGFGALLVHTYNKLARFSMHGVEIGPVEWKPYFDKLGLLSCLMSADHKKVRAKWSLGGDEPSARSLHLLCNKSLCHRLDSSRIDGCAGGDCI